MEQKQTISEIGECVIEEMERLGYSPLTIQGFRRDVQQLANSAFQKTGEKYFSEELGTEYLHAAIGFPFETPHRLTSKEGECIRCVRRIGEYQLYGVLRPRATKVKDSTGWELDDGKIISSFIESMQTADNSEATKKLRIHHIQQFYGFLGSRKLDGYTAYRRKSFPTTQHLSKGIPRSMRNTVLQPCASIFAFYAKAVSWNATGPLPFQK